MDVSINNVSLTRADILLLLSKMSGEFTPPLAQSLDIERYADKLYDHANIVTCKVDGETEGFAAYYKNDNLRQLYIPLICVSSKCRHLGFGRKMLSEMARHCGDFYTSMGLEVRKDNGNAYGFYVRQGFTIAKEHGDKWLMTKRL